MYKEHKYSSALSIRNRNTTGKQLDKQKNKIESWNTICRKKYYFSDPSKYGLLIFENPF